MTAPLIRLADRIRALNGPTMVIDPIRYERADSTLTRIYMERIMDGLHRNIPMIVADAISEYYYNGTDREHWDLKQDFPLVIPPFPEFWIEWTRPTQIRSSVYGIVPASTTAFEISGLHVVCTDPSKSTVDLSVSWGEDNRHLFRDFCKDARFVWLLNPCGYVKETFCTPSGTFWLATDDRGNIINYVVITYGDQRDSDLLSAEAPLFIHPGILALTFMNLKNGALSPPTRYAPDKFAKNWERRKHQPLIRYYTVVVDPNRTTKPTLPGPGSGREMPLHLVRGSLVHYADEDGKRLFGKYHGTYFRPPHTRGKKEAGISIHDYSVKPPKGKQG
jgi:hypothetical protein